MILSNAQLNIMREANKAGGVFNTVGWPLLKQADLADLAAQGLVETAKDKPGWYAVTAAGNMELASTVL